MAVTRLKTWVANEVLFASDLNAEFDRIINNGQTVGFPRTSNADFNGYTLILDADADTTLRASTDDQVDIAIGGTDTYRFTSRQLTINGNRVLTESDKARLEGMFAPLATVAARVNSIDSRVLAMTEMTNF